MLYIIYMYIVEFKSENFRQLSKRLRLSLSWEPLCGSSEPPQLGLEIGVSGEATKWLPLDTSVVSSWPANN